jgi:hypothetical protein
MALSTQENQKVSDWLIAHPSVDACSCGYTGRWRTSDVFGLVSLPGRSATGGYFKVIPLVCTGCGVVRLLSGEALGL